jgi:hypothetical protein
LLCIISIGYAGGANEKEHIADTRLPLGTVCSPMLGEQAGGFPKTQRLTYEALQKLGETQVKLPSTFSISSPTGTARFEIHGPEKTISSDPPSRNTFEILK